MSFSELAGALDHFERLWLEDHPQRPRFDDPSTLERMRRFLESHPDVFQRHHPVGHFTGSALLVDGSLSHVALTLHKKLGRWLQFGGHADGHTRLDEVAWREAQEESGLESLEFVPYESQLSREAPQRVPLDLDIHEIPPWRDTPSHYHYDVAYLMRSPGREPLRGNDESDQVAWFTLEEARLLCQEEALQRQFRKIEWLRQSAGE